jgi:S-adenosylmethionine decarboxylase
MDYRVRGFTRDIKGKKHYIDHKINSIQNFLAKDTKNLYQMVDVNMYQENIFHTKMILREFDLDNYLFDISARDLPPAKSKQLHQRLQKEMLEIFYAQNMPKLSKS